MKKARILVVGPFPPKIGGVTEVILNIIDSELKYKYNFIPFSTTRPVKKKANACHGYRTFFSSGILRMVIGLFITLFQLHSFPFKLILSNPKIVHIHTGAYFSFFENSYYVLISKLFNKKTILHIHAGEPFDKFFYENKTLFKKMIKYVLEKNDKIIVLNHETKIFINKLIKKNKSELIFNATETKITVHKKEDKKKINVLFIGGATSERKGVFDILKAIPTIIKNNPSIHFFIGSTNKKVREICNYSKIKRNISFFNYIIGKQKKELFNKCNIFLLPTYSEGHPISILEAAVYRMAIVTTPVSSIPEVIKNNHSGFLINPGDYKDLANKILLLAEKNKLRNSFTKNAFERVDKEFSLDVFSKKLDELYKNII